jgi:DNA-binding beta-propeller fold protein YncE
MAVTQKKIFLYEVRSYLVPVLLPTAPDRRMGEPRRILMRITHHILVAALLFAGSFCASLQGQKPAEAGASSSLVWPPLPAPTRVKWVGEYRSEFDVGAKKRTSFLDRLAGKSQDAMWLKQPVSIAVDERGVIFVGDTQLGIVGLDPSKKRMWLFSKLSPEAPTAATGIAVDSKFVYATDSAQNQLSIYDKEGRRLKTVGPSDGIQRPVGVAVDEAKDLVVLVNGGDHTVLLFNRSLKLIKKLGSRGEKPGQFNFPTYCCMVPGQGFAVADTANFRVQFFNFEGKFLSTFGKQGDYSGSFSMPKGMAVDAEGNLYVVDAKFCNFQVFRTDGQVLLYVGTGGTAPGTFQIPCGIAITKDGSVFVADTVNARVQRFQYVPDTTSDKGKSAPAGRD